MMKLPSDPAAISALPYVVVLLFAIALAAAALM